MLRRLVLCLALAGSAALPAAAFDLDSTPGKLPKDVLPQAYTVSLAPDIAKDTISGTERVTLRVRRATAKIVLNTLDITIGSAKVDGVPVLAIVPDGKQQITTFTLAKQLAPGMHELALEFAGKLRHDASGLFVTEYTNPDGSRSKMLATQFESTDARSMFPCWDEPAFRATFELTAQLPAGWAAISNTPVMRRGTVPSGAQVVTFGRTPRMPSYLVVLAAGELARISSSDGVVDHGVWGPRGRQTQGTYALDTSKRVLAFYNAYFGRRYPLPKLDHIAVPGGFGGAMENWGGITYNDTLILLSAGAGEDRRQSDFSVVAHEMAHQWFGDLVTMSWWDDIWLNESFASWMGAKVTDHLNPEWLWYEGQDDRKERAMDADARANVHPIQQHIVDELQAEASFDSAITYDKGQTVLRMLEGYLGPETFRRGVGAYIRAHQYSNAASDDLWHALDRASGKNVTAIANSWIKQPGYPVIGVTASCGAGGARTIALSQQRFLLSGTASGTQRWAVPMQIASGAGPARTVLLGGVATTVPAGRCGEPLRANAGDGGYYRVAYDAATLAANTRAFPTLPVLDRLPLLDDEWAFVRAGKVTLDAYLPLVKAMRYDRDAATWKRAIGVLSDLEQYERGSAGHDAFAAYARALVAPVYASLGWSSKPGETFPRRQLRREVIAALGAWGDPAVIAAARARFAHASSMTADEAGVVLPIVGTWADAATLDQLAAMARTSKDDASRERAYDAIADVADPGLTDRALAIVTGSDVPPQLEKQKRSWVYAMAARHPKAAWDYFQAHLDALMAPYSPFSRYNSMAQGVPRTFALGTTAAERRAWSAAHVPPSLKGFSDRGLEEAEALNALRTRLVPQADAYIKTHPAG